jgi:hypothetical protein
MTDVMHNAVHIWLDSELIYGSKGSVGTKMYRRSSYPWGRGGYKLQLHFSVIVIDYR